jgi:hypothetical protein
MIKKEIFMKKLNKKLIIKIRKKNFKRLKLFKVKNKKKKLKLKRKMIRIKKRKISF